MDRQIDLKALLESRAGSTEPGEGSQPHTGEAEMNVPRNLMFDAESTDFKPETKPVAAPAAGGLTVEEAKEFDDEMNRFIDTVLIAGIDYGLIPHCNKPTLLKSGAEKVLNYLGLIARTKVSNRVEDYNAGFFSYEAKVYLIDSHGIIRGEGIGITNTREGRYAKASGYAVQNTVLKMAKKRALVDAALNVGNLSARFTQDVEDMNLEPDNAGGRNPDELKQSAGPKASASRPATKKQLAFLEKLMKESGSTPEALNSYVQKVYKIDDYRKAASFMASELIDRELTIL